ncbi:hypothetical protein FHG87_014306 [Trinorchestia longiramus]|nr:hypothetical protein FHG87_014306 [Trinorchestia longiramus]
MMLLVQFQLQLLVIACLFALSSALEAKRPSRLASGLSYSSRINNFGLTARDDDFYICFRGYCFKCDRKKKCNSSEDCDDDDDDEFCINGYCCEYHGHRCRSVRDCENDDDDDDDD